jgi:hypothetical protein
MVKPKYPNPREFVMKHFALSKPGDTTDLLALSEQIERDFPDTGLSRAQIHYLIQGEALAAGVPLLPQR